MVGLFFNKLCNRRPLRAMTMITLDKLRDQEDNFFPHEITQIKNLGGDFVEGDCMVNILSLERQGGDLIADTARHFPFGFGL